jgi:transglutaminase-like putative cysteine protease
MRHLTLAAIVLAAFVAGCTTSRQTGSGGGENGDSAEKTGKERHGSKTGTFDAVNTFTLEIPEDAGEVNAWFAMPQKSNADQVISNWKVECDHKTTVVKDELGNEFLHLKLSRPEAGTVTVKTSFRIKRHEVNMTTDPAKTRPHTSDELQELAPYLKEQNEGKVTDDIRAMAKQVVGDEKNPLKVGRLLYDAVIDHVQYWVIDPDNLKSSGKGSATYTYEKCTGNCTDFHGLYHALCMAVDLPCRTVYGGFFKGPLDGVDKDQSYHCWLEIHAPNVGWVPLDVSIADLYAQEIELNDANRDLVNLTLPDGYHGKDMKKVDYYFGNLEERRVVWHEGRDLELGQKDGSINFLPWYYAEVDGKKAGIGKRKLTFNSVK